MRSALAPAPSRPHAVTVTLKNTRASMRKKQHPEPTETPCKRRLVSPSVEEESEPVCMNGMKTPSSKLASIVFVALSAAAKAPQPAGVATSSRAPTSALPLLEDPPLLLLRHLKEE